MAPEPAGLQPFIVTISVPVGTFRETLTGAIPDAQLGRELSAARVVVILPGSLAGSLAGLPGVTAVAPDELLKKLRHGPPRKSRD